MAVMTVNWKHVLLDPLVFINSGTWRVARVRYMGNEGVNAFPIPEGGAGRWESETRNWTPSLAGLAPPQYEYPDPPGRIFNFKFWSLKEFQNEAFKRGSSTRTNEFDVNYTEGVIRIEATAFYYWDFADGPGGHAVFVDAFDDNMQEFIPDDFVDVIPDNRTGSLTREANNGRLGTETPEIIAGVVIRARNPTGDNASRQYQFRWWTNEQDLSRINPETVPMVEGRDIRVHSGSVISALAHYNPMMSTPPVFTTVPWLLEELTITWLDVLRNTNPWSDQESFTMQEAGGFTMQEAGGFTMQEAGGFTMQEAGGFTMQKNIGGFDPRLPSGTQPQVNQTTAAPFVLATPHHAASAEKFENLQTEGDLESEIARTRQYLEALEARKQSCR